MPDLLTAQAYLANLNLDYVIKAMCSEHYPLPRWQPIDAERCCRLYKNFLWLHTKYNNHHLVPTREIDEFWHNHILYTRYYARDCLAIFGYYLHHEPQDPADDPTLLLEQYLQTKQYYFDEFGEDLTPV